MRHGGHPLEIHEPKVTFVRKILRGVPHVAELLQHRGDLVSKFRRSKAFAETAALASVGPVASATSQPGRKAEEWFEESTQEVCDCPESRVAGSCSKSIDAAADTEILLQVATAADCPHHLLHSAEVLDHLFQCFPPPRCKVGCAPPQGFHHAFAGRICQTLAKQDVLQALWLRKN